MKRVILGLSLAALAIVSAACSGATAAPATDAPNPSAPAGDEIVIVAKDMKFQTTSVTVKANEPVTIVLDNQESVPHNIAVKDASGAEVFKGEIVTNTKAAGMLPPLAPGTYSFLCEVHPDMKGTITAE